MWRKAWKHFDLYEGPECKAADFDGVRSGSEKTPQKAAPRAPGDPEIRPGRDFPVLCPAYDLCLKCFATCFKTFSMARGAIFGDPSVVGVIGPACGR